MTESATVLDDTEQTRTLEARHLEDRFTRVYHSNMWLDGESLSGPGSRADSQPVIETLEVLKLICHRFDIRSIADVPCGDLNWITGFLRRYPAIRYAGFDIVKPLIAHNRLRQPELDCRFLDITRSVPPAVDLVLCKDLAIHLNEADIRAMLRNIKQSGSKYVLLSNNFGLPNGDLHENLYGDSVCRYVDITAPPFSCSAPLWRSDYLGLWKLSDAVFG